MSDSIVFKPGQSLPVVAIPIDADGKDTQLPFPVPLTWSVSDPGNFQIVPVPASPECQVTALGTQATATLQATCILLGTPIAGLITLSVQPTMPVAFRIVIKQ